jgi:hypothetical protein
MSTVIVCCCNVSTRHNRRFQERLTELEYQWRFAPPETRLSIERSMLSIIAMEEAIFRA